MGVEVFGEAAAHAMRRPSSATRHNTVTPALRPNAADRVLAITLAAVPIAGIVLFGAVEPEHAMPLETIALLLGAGAVIARVWRGDRPLPAPGVTLPVLLLAAMPALQLIPLPAGIPAILSPGLQRFGATSLRTLSVDPVATSFALIRWLSYAAFLVAAIEIAGRRGTLPTVLTAVALLGVFEAVYGIANLAFGNRYLLWLPRDGHIRDATGTLVNRNHYAAVFELCLPALLARRSLAQRSARHERRRDDAGLTALYVGAATIMGLAALLSRSRAGTLSLAVGMFVPLIVAARDAHGRQGRRMLSAVIVLVLLYGSWLGLNELAERFTRDDVAVRPALWSDTARLVFDFPVVGAGAGSFETAFPAYRQRASAQVGYAHAHQDYLEFFAEGGFCGVLLALLSGVSFIRLTGGTTGNTSFTVAALKGALVAALVHAAFDFPLHIPGLVWLLLLISASCLAATSVSMRASGR